MAPMKNQQPPLPRPWHQMALCGVATAAAGDVFSYDALFARADAALYRAKQEGRDRVVSDDPVLVAS